MPACIATKPTPTGTSADYRGQNANMHMCEAMLAAFEASGERRYLDRALTLADHITRRQAAKADGLVWEHYDRDWNVDWDYHRDDPKHLFRPWGFQPGHLTEWAKLLLILDAPPARARHGAGWLLPTARHLFDTAVARAWDDESRRPLLRLRAGRQRSATTTSISGCRPNRSRRRRGWRYAPATRVTGTGTTNCGPTLAAFRRPRHGAWYRILDRDNRKYSDEKSPAGKTDYHTMGACYEVLHAGSAVPGACLVPTIGVAIHAPCGTEHARTSAPSQYCS